MVWWPYNWNTERERRLECVVDAANLILEANVGFAVRSPILSSYGYGTHEILVFAGYVHDEIGVIGSGGVFPTAPRLVREIEAP